MIPVPPSFFSIVSLNPSLTPPTPHQSLEHVLQNINRLNRNLEGVIAVGDEFGAVEALWSRFEGVMGGQSGEKEGEGGERNQEDGDEVEEEAGERKGRGKE